MNIKIAGEKHQIIPSSLDENQLAAFDKAEDDLNTDLEQWLFVIKHLSKFVDIPRFIRKPIFKTLFKIAEDAALTKEERMAYETHQEVESL